MARPESLRLAAAWDEAAAAGGGGPLAVVDEAAGEGRLALLASMLTAARPAGYEFGLGLVAAMAATGEREAAAAQTARAATTAQGAAEEARRRAEAARVAAAAEIARLDGALRDERRARRQLERSATGAAGSDARRVDLEAALTEARQGLAAAEELAIAAERRAIEAERRTAAAARGAAAAERRAGSAELALSEVERRAVAAERRAAEAERRAAEAERRAAEAERRAVAAESDAAVLEGLSRPAPPRRPPVPPPRPGTGIEKPARGRSRPATRRAPVQVPPGMLHDDPAAVAAMVRTPGLAVIVDGYNVSMLAWPEIDAAGQRDRLCDALVEFQLRTRCEVTVVFDGADVPGRAAAAPPGAAGGVLGRRPGSRRGRGRRGDVPPGRGAGHRGLVRPGGSGGVGGRRRHGPERRHLPPAHRPVGKTRSSREVLRPGESYPSQIQRSVSAAARANPPDTAIQPAV